MQNLAVFAEFHCQSLGDYHDLYLRSDVLLLADVCSNYYQLKIKKIFKKLTLAKTFVLDVSATDVAFFSKRIKCECLTAS